MIYERLFKEKDIYRLDDLWRQLDIDLKTKLDANYYIKLLMRKR
nr:hypothetical protein [Mycoplasmopsis bovis]